MRRWSSLYLLTFVCLRFWICIFGSGGSRHTSLRITFWGSLRIRGGRGSCYFWVIGTKISLRRLELKLFVKLNTILALLVKWRTNSTFSHNQLVDLRWLVSGASRAFNTLAAMIGVRSSSSIKWLKRVCSRGKSWIGIVDITIYTCL